MLNRPWVRNAIIAGILILGVVLMVLLQKVVVPVFIALTIGYIFDPVIDRFEKWKVSRTWGIVIVIFLLTLAVTGLVVYLIPKLAHQIRVLADLLPGYWDTLKEKAMPQLTAYAEEHPEYVEEFKVSATNWLKENAGMLASNITTGIGSSFRSMGNFIANVVSLVIIPVLAFYFLRDFDLLKAKAADLIPLKRRQFVVDLFTEIDQALGNFIKGQMLVAIILSVIYSVGLTIADCPAPLLIGLLAGFANLVPYLGLALGFVPAVLLTYLSGNPLWQVIFAAATFVVGQMLEGMVITPKVVGDSVGLHPVVVMVALMLGGTYFGFVGMILALPVAAVLMVLIRRGYQFYLGSVLYHEEDRDPPPGPSLEAKGPVVEG